MLFRNKFTAESHVISHRWRPSFRLQLLVIQETWLNGDILD